MVHPAGDEESHLEAIASESQVPRSTLTLSWRGFEEACLGLAKAAPQNFGLWKPERGIWGIPTGGAFVALEMARHLHCPILDQPAHHCLLVDDLVDSGSTMRRVLLDAPERVGYFPAALFRKPHSPPVAFSLRTLHRNEWVIFPWERNHPAQAPGFGPEDAVRRLLEWIGEDPNREGLRDTPGRVVRALSEMTCGYRQDPAHILERTFQVPHDEMVLLKGIRFTSLCEHHLLPFQGKAAVCYIPCAKDFVPGKLAGVSKLARLVGCLACRLQIQERLTATIADAIVTHLQPQGVGVVLEATHECMACRGVQQPGSRMVTSAVRGVLRTDASARAEFLHLLGD